MPNPTYDVCVVGGGVAASFAAEQLLQAGASVVQLCDRVGDGMRPMELERKTFNVLPVFPVLGDSRTRRMLESGAAREDARLSVTHRASGASLSLEPAGYRTRLFAKKLFGIDSEPYPAELQRKIARHYGPRPLERLGFVDGVSPFWRYIRDLPVQRVNWTGSSINLAKRRVNGETAFAYGRLIWTRPLPLLTKELPMATSVIGTRTFVAADAHFMVFQVSEKTDSNHIVYDLTASAPVVRAFSPCPGVLVAQVASGEASSPATVGETCRNLMDLKGSCRHITDVRAAGVYPLEVIPDIDRSAIRNDLDALGVTIFGRFGQWEYLDIHELDWDALLRVV